MVAVPFCGQSYTDRTLNANAQECINFYPMRSPSIDDPNRVILYPTPGYKLYSSFSQLFGSLPGYIGTEIRGLFTVNSVLYVVYGNALISVTNGALKTLGFLNSSSGKVSITCNTVELVMADSVNGYVYNLSTGAFVPISNGIFPTSGGVTNFTYIDGYILAANNNSKTIIQSELLAGGLWDAQAFATITSFADNIVAVFSDQLQLYIFGPKLTEVRFDAATIPFAFEKVQGVLIQAGCAAKNTIVKVAGTIIWLASDEAGKAYVAALTGYAPKVLSTAPINEAIERYTTVSDAFAYSYREADSQFYCLTFPTAGITWVYDLHMQMWHKRSYNGGADLPNCYVTWQGNHLVGDAAGNLWFMSQDYSQADFGLYGPFTDINASFEVPQYNPPVRTRTGPHLEAGGKLIFLDELEIFYEAGVGLNVQTINSGGTIGGTNQANLVTAATNPQATLEISRDGGHTWTNVGTKDMGKIGKYRNRMVWRRLGKARHFTFRLTVSDPVRSYILGSEARIRVASK